MKKNKFGQNEIGTDARRIATSIQKMPQLVLNQGASDALLIAGKSSDVAHGATNFGETDTYFKVQKSDGDSGGANIIGLKDADGGNNKAVLIQGYLAENTSTTKTTAGTGIVEIWGLQTSGAGITDTVADGNVIVFRTRRSSAYVTVAIIDEDGDILYDGAASAYDQYDDALMCADLAQVMSGQYSQIISTNREMFEELGIIGPADENGRFMMSTKKSTALLLGAIGQLYQRCQRLESKLALLVTVGDEACERPL